MDQTPESPTLSKRDRRAYLKQWKATHPEHDREYYERNHAAIRERRKKRRRDPDHKAKQSQHHKTWREKQKGTQEWQDRLRDQKAIRRAREYGSKVERISWRQVWASFTGTCNICTKPLHLGIHRYHFDHIVALARGGAHTTSNLQVTHATCNFSKSCN